MTLRDCLSGWFGWKRNSRCRRPASRLRKTYLFAETLESRCVPTTTINTLGSFDGSNGSQPEGGLVVEGSSLFGTTNLGGDFSFGTIFQVIPGNPNPITAIGSFDGSNGANPRAGLVEDSSGNLFGTAYQGGSNDLGTVFKAHKGDSQITMVAAFDGDNGANPSGGVIVDNSGNLFGTTSQGGSTADGTIFEVVQGSNTITTLASITGGADGASPSAGVIEDAHGNLFGTTDSGGASGAGTVYELVQGSPTITPLASFTGSGAVYPSGLVEDSNGNLFGTTYQGGDFGDGMVFEVVHGSGTVTTIASFNGDNGSGPRGGLLMDAAGNLFGTTFGGGDSGNGTVFEVLRGSNTITTLVSFEGNPDGTGPLGNLTMDPSGNLYGTTYFGGSSSAGTVFEIPPPPPSFITTATLPSWTVNQPGYNQTISTTGGAAPISFTTSGGLPPGLTLSSNGVLSGTPTLPGHFTFAVTATDASNSSVSQNFVITINSAISVTTATLPNWTDNWPGYRQTINATGGTGTLTFSSSGTQPAGLTLSTTGILSGTPRAAGTFTFTVTATDTVGATGSQTYTVTINASVVVGPTTLPDWTVNQSGYNQTIATTGGTGSLTTSLSGTLPTGLTLSSGNVLSGTPTATGSFTFTVSATDTLGASGSRTFTVHINPPVGLSPATLPSGTLNAPYLQTITASGGTGAESLSVTGVTGSIPGLTVPMTGTGSLVISGTPTATGRETFTVTVMDASGASTSIAYTLTVTSAINLTPTTLPAGTANNAYNQTITASGGSGTLTLTVSSVSGTIPGLTVPASGSNSLAITGTPTAAGTVTFTVTATDSLGASTKLDYSITINPALVLSPGSLPQGTAGARYNQTIMAGGGTGTVTLSVSGIAGAIGGLTVPSSGTGSLVISGVPSAPGTETFTITATDSAGAVTVSSYSITVNPGLAVSTTSLPPDTVNVAYSQAITASGGTGTVTLTVSGVTGAIPGLNVPTSATGTLVISGTPVAAGTETFTVTVSDSAGASLGVTYTIVINPNLIFTPGTLPQGSPNTAYNQTITASGGTGTVSLAVTGLTGSIPGLTIPTSGTGSVAISGTPTGPGSVSFTITATDAVGATASTNYTINILSPTAYLSMPTSGFNGATNATLASFPISISQLSDGTRLGLATATIYLTYPTGVFGFQTGGNWVSNNNLVHLGMVPLSDTAAPGGAADWDLTANSPADGQLSISLTAVVGDSITSDTGGGTLVTIDFPILGTAPLGNVPLNIVYNSSGHTQIFGNNGLFALSPLPPYSGNINIILGGLTITPTTLAPGDVGTKYLQTITASGGVGPFTYAVTSGTLPPGTELFSSTGILSGGTQTKGTYTFTVTATDSRGAMGSQSYTVVVNPSLAIATSSLPPASAGTAYDFTLTTSGGSPPVTFSVPPSSSLPAGLSLSPDGILSGTPTTAGAYNFTVTAADSAFAGFASRTYTLTVGAGPATEFLVSTPGVSTVQAGNGFLVVVQAADQYGNPVTSSYTGPGSLFITLSPPIVAGSLPGSVVINNHGLGLFVATLDQVGTFTIAVTDGGTFSGSASPVTVTPGPATQLHFVGRPFNTPTGLTMPPVDVQVLDAYGNLVTGDNTDKVTMSVGSGPAGAPGFTSGSTLTAPVVNGVADFSNLTLVVPGSYQLSAVVPGRFTGPYSSVFTIQPLEVLPGSLVGSPSGFSLQFNAPYLVNSLTPVLYGQGPLPPSVIVTTDPGHLNDLAAYVAGTLYLTPDSITFLVTNTTQEANNGVPVLPDGTYTVIVRGSAANNGFQALNSGGGLLDGKATGVAGSGDFVGTFTVNAAALKDDIVWAPSTADGPGQPLVAPGMNQLGGGYPIYLADSTGAVTHVHMTLTYDPTLLNVMGVAGSGFTMLGSSTPGRAILEYSGPALPTGSQTPIGYLIATVPSGTAASPIPYRAKDLLHLSGVSLNGGATPVVTSDGIHLVAYVGDANGDGVYSSDDAVRITRVTLQTDTGFAAYPLVDPVIVTDTDGSGFIPADAALQVNEAGVGVATMNLPRPPLPGGTHFQPVANNVDPQLSLVIGHLSFANDQGQMTSDYSVAVNIDDAHPAGSTGLIEGHLALRFDPTVFTVSATDIHLGSVLSAGGAWTLTPTIDAATGQIAIVLSSDTAIISTEGGSLVTIEFHAVGNFSNSSSIALVASAAPYGQEVATELQDAQGTFTLSQSSSIVTISAPAIQLAAPAAVVNQSQMAAFETQVVPSAIVETTTGAAAVVADSNDPGSVTVPAQLVEEAFVRGSAPPVQASAAIGTAINAFVPAGPLTGLLLTLSGTPMLAHSGNVSMGWQHLADQLFQILARTAGNDTGLFGTIQVLDRAVAGQLLLVEPAADKLNSLNREDSGSDLDWTDLGVSILSSTGDRRDLGPRQTPPAEAESDVVSPAQIFSQAADDTDLLMFEDD